jgi:AraC-like DNA-binding protein
MPRESDLVFYERLIREELKRFVCSERVEDTNSPKEVHALLEFIHHHLFDNSLSVSHLKQACQMNNNNISTRFKKSVGLGIHQYIARKRMAAAAKLLEQEELPVFLLASAVGYSHEESFTRAFRRHFGCAPTVYRQKLAQKNAKRKC